MECACDAFILNGCCCFVDLWFGDDVARMSIPEMPIMQPITDEAAAPQSVSLLLLRPLHLLKKEEESTTPWAGVPYVCVAMSDRE